MSCSCTTSSPVNTARQDAARWALTALLLRGGETGTVEGASAPFRGSPGPQRVAVAPFACPGDFNSDNAVNTSDLVAFLGQFGGTCDSLPQGTRCGDFNSDNLVNTTDLVAFLVRFEQTCP